MRATPSESKTTSNNMAKVEIYTDGACRGNPGPGGWGVLMRAGKHEKELCGGEHHTTNNRMELLGAIAGLEALTRPCLVTMTTDSQYVKKGMTEWIDGWGDVLTGCSGLCFNI